ncbi:MAG: hypothetical protein K0A90_09735 [Methanosarcinaceae archaeon]|nr:hypothetical protein [Methanosarcinaceae archaeon]
MFKVTIKQYVKPLCALILIAAVLNSGCLESTSSNTATTNGVPDVPIKAPADEKVLKTTPDGMTFYGSPKGNDNIYLSSYDTDGDGDLDARDRAVNQAMAYEYHNGNMNLIIFSFFGIPKDSKLHQDYPNIEEFRVRQWDLDGDDKFKEKVEIIINDKVIYSTTTDIDGKNGVNMGDAFLDLGWV